MADAYSGDTRRVSSRPASDTITSMRSSAMSRQARANGSPRPGMASSQSEPSTSDGSATRRMPSRTVADRRFGRAGERRRLLGIDRADLVEETALDAPVLRHGTEALHTG